MPASKSLMQLTNHTLSAITSVATMHQAAPTEMMAILIHAATQYAIAIGVPLEAYLGAVQQQVRNQWDGSRNPKDRAS